MRLLDTTVQDLRHGLTLLQKNVGYTFVAVLALALGIGVNAAVFIAYKAMVARRLDAREPGAMANVALVRQTGDFQFKFSYPDYEDYRDLCRSFNGLIAFGIERLAMTQAGELISERASVAESALGKIGLLSSGTANAELVTTFLVSENYFDVLGIPAQRGRTFGAIPVARLLASPSVLISDNYWQQRFGGDPAVLGRSLRLNGLPVTIIGVTPRNFTGTSVAVPNFWLPIHLAPLVHSDPNWLTDRETERLRLFGRLAPGTTFRRAQSDVAVVSERVRARHDQRSDSARPATARVWEGSPFPLPLTAYRGLNLAILLIMCAAGMVMVVACGNVASLQLARSKSRINELQTRLSLGATRGRLVRQLLTESLILGLISGAVAMLITWVLLSAGVPRLAEALPPDYGTLAFDVAPDATVVLYVLAISVAGSVLFGLMPALESSRTAWAQSSRSLTAPSSSRRAQELFVAVQVALALVLLVAGSLLVRGSLNVLRTDVGYDSHHLLSVDYSFPTDASRYTVERRHTVAQEIRARLASLPGVAAVTSGRAPADSPFQTVAAAWNSRTTAAGQQATLHYTYVQPNYFQTVGVGLILGEGFPSAADAAEHAVILSESAARILWPGESPIGQLIRLGPIDERPHVSHDVIADGPVFQVKGIVKDIRGVEFDGSNSKQVYLVLPEKRLQDYPILVRTVGDPAGLLKGLDPVLSAIDRDLLATTSTLDETLRQSAPFLVSTLSAAVASTVGLVGLLLAAMGIYGTVNYMVVQRTREVGIRMALGATPRAVVTLILQESSRPVAIGLLCGLGLGAGASRLLRSVLYGIHTVDLISFAAVSALFLCVSLIATFAPARRAAAVDPSVALRYE